MRGFSTVNKQWTKVVYLTFILRTRAVYELIAIANIPREWPELLFYYIDYCYQETSPCSYIFLKYGRFSNIKNLSIYLIKLYFLFFKKNVLANFAESFKLLVIFQASNVLGETSTCWPRNRAQFFYHIAFQNSYNVFQLSRDLFSINSEKTNKLYFYLFRWHLNQVLTFKNLGYMLYFWQSKAGKILKTIFCKNIDCLRSKNFQQPSCFSTSRIWANILLVAGPIRLQNI